MKEILSIVLLMVISMGSLRADDIPISIRKQANNLFGEKVNKIDPRTFSNRVMSLCAPAKFYTITIPIPEDSRIDDGSSDWIHTMVSTEKRAFAVTTTKEITTFLTSLKKPVLNELKAFERTLVFAELIGATVRTRIPQRKSMVKQYMDQERVDWPLVLEGTESGWTVSVTLMTLPDIEYCIRYKLGISRRGDLLVLSEKTIYAYALYE